MIFIKIKLTTDNTPPKVTSTTNDSSNVKCDPYSEALGECSMEAWL